MKEHKKCCDVSVIIPAYNVEHCIRRAIFSVLDQTHPPIEVIVINDGSVDGTKSVVGEFGNKIIYIEQNNKGAASARNVGIKAASSEFIAFLDADDYWLPGFLEATVRFLRMYPEAIAVSTGWQIRTLNGLIQRFPNTEHNEFIWETILLDDFFSFWGKYDHVRTGTVLIRCSKLENNGLQRDELFICEDIEYWGYLATYGKWGFIPEELWVGDSARVAASQGSWIARYKKRRSLAPSVDDWQKRIILRLSKDQLNGFTKIKGRIALIIAHCLLLSCNFQQARKVVATYESILPLSKISLVLKKGNQYGSFFWYIICLALLVKEHQKSLSLSLKRNCKNPRGLNK